MKSKNKKNRTRSGSIPLDQNPKEAAANNGNNSMSFGGDSDGSIHKNSDDDNLLKKKDALSPQHSGGLSSKRPKNDKKSKVNSHAHAPL